MCVSAGGLVHSLYNSFDQAKRCPLEPLTHKVRHSGHFPITEDANVCEFTEASLLYFHTIPFYLLPFSSQAIRQALHKVR
jgi:hypothetical protein